MKSSFIIRAMIFITFFSVLMLFGCTRVDDLDQYNKLYEEYASKKYEGFEHFEKQEKARLYMHSYGYQNMAPKFDVIMHRHILVVLCGRFVNFLRGDYNEEMSWAMLPDTIANLRHEYGWDEKSFIWAYNVSMNSTDSMISYAKKFLKSENGISPKTQLIDLVSSVNVSHINANYAKNIKQIPQFCRNLETIYNIMSPS
ncbi:hypothetical protein V3564_04960 [Bartonella sp. B12(2025)]